MSLKNWYRATRNRIYSSIRSDDDMDQSASFPNDQEPVATVIHTCDKYDFLWDGWYHYFRKSWDFDRYPVYFMNETKSVEFKGVTQIKTGEGAWSDRLSAGLCQLEEKRVLYMQEDFWPRVSIDLDGYIRAFSKLDADSLRITPDCIHFITYKPFRVQGLSVRRHAKSSDYPVCHQPGIWKKEFLLQCLDKGESPWVNEVEGTKRVRHREFNIFLSELDWYAATCRAGKLTREGVEMLEAAGLPVAEGRA